MNQPAAKPTPPILNGVAASSIPPVPDYSVIPNAITALSARFTVLRLISASEDARLYLACDNDSSGQGHLVRLKVFLGKSQAELASALHQARAAAKLSHANIVRAFPPEQINGINFAVIEHCTGVETLKDLLNRRGWLSPDRTINLIRQVCEAFNYAHNAGVLHLRIRPESILLGRDGNVRVEDFGVEAGGEFAWVHADRSRHCPAQFLSPEQVNDQPVDHRSDLYSLGVLFYNMVVDRLPFNSEKTDDLKHKITTRQAVPPHLYSDHVPVWLSSMITNLLEKNPERRIQSVAGVISQLERLAPSYGGITEQASGPPQQQTPNYQQEGDKSASTAVQFTSQATDSLVQEGALSPPATDVDRFAEEAAESKGVQPKIGSPEGRRLESWEPPSIQEIPPPVGKTFPGGSEQASAPYREIEDGAHTKAFAPAPSIKPSVFEGPGRTDGLKWVIALCLGVITISALIVFARARRAETKIENQPPSAVAGNPAGSVSPSPVPENSPEKVDAGHDQPLSPDPGSEDKGLAAESSAVIKPRPRNRAVRKVSKAQPRAKVRARRAKRRALHFRRDSRIYKR